MGRELFRLHVSFFVELEYTHALYTRIIQKVLIGTKKSHEASKFLFFELIGELQQATQRFYKAPCAGYLFVTGSR